MSYDKNSEWKCPDCRKPIEGAIIIATGNESGAGGIFLDETLERNWIQCSGCNRIVCKARCCRNPQSGYCNACLSGLNQSSVRAHRKRRLTVLVIGFSLKES